MLILLALALGAASPGLTAAKAHLQSGEYDQLALDLDGATPEGERTEAANLLAQASQVARDKKDKLMALQLAQMAIRKDPHQASALRLETEMALEDEQLTEAEHTSEALLAAKPSDPGAALLRARVAAEAWDWDKVSQLVAPLLKAKKGELTPELTRQATDLDRQVRDHRAEQDKESKQMADIALELKQAAQHAAADRDEALTAQAAKPQSSGVVIYGTSWCGYCKKAKAYFQARNVAFEEKDIERDHQAKQEMIEKAQAQGMTPNGVPVIDVGGQLVQGFNVPRIESLLAKMNGSP